jgi:hypothetical protein
MKMHQAVCVLILLIAASGSPIAAAQCDGPPNIGVIAQGSTQLRVSFTNIARLIPESGGFQRCFTHYNLRWSIPNHGEQQIEVRDSACSPYPSSSCAYFMDANLQKPYRLSIQACRSRFAISSRCSPWSQPAYFLPWGPDTCIDGFLWREAFANDHVCVSRETRQQVAADNAAGAGRVEPGGGASGPGTCKPGYVWREADRNGGNTPGNDRVCVTPATRQQSWNDNAAAPTRRAKP